MRMIDANALQDQYIAKMEEIIKSTTTPNISLEALSLLCGYALIMDAPTIEIKHGYWVHDKDDDVISGYCSICGWVSCICETDVAGMPFCPNCGSPMDEVEE